MPVADTSASFLNGLSDLWLRFFKDKNQLAAVYKGTENLIGQAYLELLDTVLNLSIRNTPVWNKEYHKLLTIREDLCTYDIAKDRWVFELPDNIQSFKLLCNKILNPDALLQADVDFEIDLTGAVDELRFKANPFTSGTGGSVIDGFAWRTVQVDVAGVATDYKEIAFWVPDAQLDRGSLYTNYGYLLSYYAPSSTAYKALLQGIMQYFVLGPTLNQVVSTLNVCAGMSVIRLEGEILQSVDYTDATVNVVTTDQNEYVFPKNVPLRDDVEDSTNWTVLTFVAYEPLTTLFSVQDHITNPTWWHNATIPASLTYVPGEGAPEPHYRREADPFLFSTVVGASLRRVGDPGFCVGADEDGTVPIYTTVCTFTHGTEVVNKTAHGLAVGTPIMFTSTGALPTGLSSTVQYTVFNPTPNTFQLHTPAGVLATFTSNGSGTRSYITQRAGLAHNFAYVAFERYIRNHMFAVVYDPTVLQSVDLPVPIWDTNFSSIIIAGKPAYVTMYADPSIQLMDTMTFNTGVPPDPSWLSTHDTINIGVATLREEEVANEPNQALIGGAWNIGDYYVYDPAGTVIIGNDSWAPPVLANGDTYVVVGGADPYIFPVNPSLAPYISKTMDWPVQVRVF